MGVFAEERKRGTMELLMTSPITEAQIVLGKFLRIAYRCSRSCCCPPPVTWFTCFCTAIPLPPWRMLLAGYAGILLLGGSLLCAGHVHFLAYRKSADRGGAHLRGFLVASGCWIWARTAKRPRCRRSCNIFP